MANELANENPYMVSPARIVRKYNLTKDTRFFQMRFTNKEKALSFNYKPGQFIIMSIFGVGEAPFSISSTPSRPGLLEFCIRKVGRFTTALFELKENDIVGIRGPYGNGFPIEKMEDYNLLIVAGGLGAAPLRSVLLYALDNRDRFNEIYFLYGAKTPGDMLFRDEFIELSKRDDLNCLLTVDKDDTGTWQFNIGVVTKLFDLIKNLDGQKTYATVCGPPVMYKFVIKELLKLNIPKHQILMTLERRMKCGVGKCGHCAIEHLYTCLDGPVFTYWDVIHMKELI
ncbi:MAG: FAD/NAD(P)-binding protein [Candidatus Asgardarchaeia archaeon]